VICEAVIGTALRADGSTSLPTLGSTPPIRLMPTPEGVFMVGAAAGPLNGDRTSLEIFVAPGTELTVRTVAASLAWPGTSPVASQFSIVARVGAGATLNWLPEPLVPVAGSIHRVVADINVEPGGKLIWREEIVLGRHDEAPGELSSRLEISRGGEAILRQENMVGGAQYDTPAVLGDGGATGSITLVSDALATVPAPPSTIDGGEAAVLELESGDRQIVAVARNATRLRTLLDDSLSAHQATRAESPIANHTEPRNEHAELGS
jgi:urease accessory protein